MALLHLYPLPVNQLTPLPPFTALTSSAAFSTHKLPLPQLFSLTVFASGRSRRSGHSPECYCLKTQGHVLKPQINRRSLVGIMPLLLIARIPTPANAKDTEESSVEYILYKDEVDNFSLQIPTNWVKAEGKASGQRKVTAFFSTDDTSTNVNVLITGLGADYTSLGSFGTADTFAENLVNSLDRSWKRPPGQVAKLISSESRNGLYYVEYTLQKPGERKVILLSAVGIGFNGWYNRLYTVTGQLWEEEQYKHRAAVEKVVSSFAIG
eukprot:c13986_g1_i2 orf=486-1283(-)